jgi:hypothetical protein
LTSVVKWEPPRVEHRVAFAIEAGPGSGTYWIAQRERKFDSGIRGAITADIDRKYKEILSGIRCDRDVIEQNSCGRCLTIVHPRDSTTFG